MPSARTAFALLAAAVSPQLGGTGCIHIGTTLLLDEDSFDDHVMKSDYLLTFVEFSSPWCIWAHPNTNGHGDCAAMRKAWDKLGDEYGSNPHVRIAEVDCSRFVTTTDEDGTMWSRESLCQRFNVRSYPTLMAYDGETGVIGKNYTGGHGLDDMVAYINDELAKFCLLDESGEATGEQCTDSDRSFLRNWREKNQEDAETELLRLEHISANREVVFGASKRAWMGRRITLLKQLRASRRPKEEPLKTEL